ncbi:MAG: hypothetical protein J7494_00300 [Sphingobium sp.]|nr:hypothetical protein [Sphingobium sp.]
MTPGEAEEAAQRSPKRIALVFAAAFVAAIALMVFLTSRFAIAPLWKMVMILAPMLLLIPMVRTIERAQRDCGNFSEALRRYNRRSLIWTFAYMVALFSAISVNKAWHPEGPLLWLIAILPSLPLFFFIYAMGRYLVEEKDEYLRQRAILAALWATGILLAVATCYGFLETFKLVPHQPGWWAVPVWAIGLAIGNLLVRRSS